MTHARRLVRRTAPRHSRRSVVKDQFRRGLLAERLEARSLLAADLGFHSDFWNVNQPSDVDADSVVAPNDALIVINTLNEEGARVLPQGQGSEGEGGGAPRMFLDVDNDGSVSPADALMVINELNGEGEPPLVHYAITPIDAAGNALTSVRVGQDFYLQMNLTDLRPFSDTEARGVYAAYTDLLYNKGLAAVAVGEAQTITLPTNTDGNFTLSLNGTTFTSTITFDNTSPTATIRGNNADAMETALNNLLGTGTVDVVPPGGGSAYRVNWISAKSLNVDQPLLQSSNVAVTVAETLKGDPTVAASFRSAITYAGNYLNGPSGADGTAPERIDELGAFYSGANFPGPGTDPVEVLRVHMLAKLPVGQNQATATFTPDFTTIDSPADDTLLLGQNGAIPYSMVTSVAGSILITSGPINAQNDAPLNPINEDDTAGVTIDVLANDTKNAGAPAGNLEVRSFTQPTGGTVTSVAGGLKFVPALNFNGTATFTYVVGIVGDTNPDDTATATVSVIVNAVNDAPVVNIPAAQNGNEDAALTINGVSVTDVDADAAAANPGVKVTIASTTGTVSLSGIAGLTFTAGDGTSDATMTFSGLTTAVNTALAGLSFTGNKDATGAASFTVTATDDPTNSGTGNTGSGGAKQDSKTVAITLAAVNDAPVNNLNGQPISSPASDQLTTPGVPLAFSAANNNLVTISDVDAGATASLNVTLSIGAGQGTIRVAGGTEQTSIPLTGTLATINTALAGLVYTPAAGFASTATLTILSNDNGATGSGGAQQTTSNITIKLDPGFRPFAVIDRLTIDEGPAVVQTIDALLNDFTEVGATTTITGVTQPAAGQGSVVINAGKLDYTPPGGDFFTPTTPITFTYTIADDVLGHNPSTGTVSITINNVNDFPVANPDSYGTSIGETLPPAPARNVLANDTTVDNNFGVANYATLSVLINANNPAVRTTTGGGSVTIAADGTFSYTPPATLPPNGDDFFTYIARSTTPQGTADSAAAQVKVHIAAPPAVTNSSVTATEDVNLPISIAANYSDGTENLPLGSVELFPAGSNVPTNAGVVTIAADGKSFLYDPADNFNTTRPAAHPGTPDAPITFTYRARATDGRASNVATVSITVNEVNDNPETPADVAFTGVKKQTGGIGENQIVTVPLTGIAPDVSETLKVTGVSSSPNGPFTATATTIGNSGNAGSVTVDANGVIKYTSPISTGSDTFYYQLSDFDATSGAARNGTSVGKVNVNVVDFVPKKVSGKIFLDLNGDGLQQANESSLGGVEVRLSGTDFLGASVSMVAHTNGNGEYIFPEKPGQPGVADDTVFLTPPKTGTTYTVTETQPRYLATGVDIESSALATNDNPADNSFSLFWVVTDTSGNVSGLTFTERGVDITNSSGDPNGQLTNANGFVTELIYTASQGYNYEHPGFIVPTTVGVPSTLWTLTLGASWAKADKVSVTLDASLAKLTLHVWDAAGTQYTRDLYQDSSSNTGVMAGSKAVFRILGVGTNGQYIIRVDATPADCRFNALVAAPAAGGEGEGESMADQDYSHAADAVFADQAWV